MFSKSSVYVSNKVTTRRPQVMPPQRGQDGAFSLSAKWMAAHLLTADDGTMIVDAMFPQQFDDHVCALDTIGNLRFWNVSSGVMTRIITTVVGARAFCFGAAGQEPELCDLLKLGRLRSRKTLQVGVVWCLYHDI